MQVLPSTSSMNPSLQAHLKVLPKGMHMSPHNWSLNCSQMFMLSSTETANSIKVFCLSSIVFQTFVVVVIIILSRIVVVVRRRSTWQRPPGRRRVDGLPRLVGAALAATHVRLAPRRAKQGLVDGAAHRHGCHDQSQFTSTAAVLNNTHN